MAAERLRHRQPLRRCERIGLAPAKREAPGPGRFRRSRQQRRAILDQHAVRLIRPIPFEHGELGMMQRPALAVAEDARKGEQPRLACGQQLLGGELRRGVQIERMAARVGGDQLGRERMQMRFVAGRDLQDRGLDLGEIAGREPRPHGGRDRAIGRSRNGRRSA